MNRKIVPIILGLSLLTACSQQEEMVNPAEIGEIRFESEINGATKVDAIGFEQGDKISVVAEDAAQTVQSAEYIFNDGIFASSTPFVKDSKGDKLTYRASYPTLSDISGDFTFEISADQSSNGYELSDLLVAQTAQTAEMTPTLQFEHALVNMIIGFKDSEGDDINVENLSVSAKNNVECNIESDTYEVFGDVANILPASYTSTEYKVIVAPQEVTTSDKFITFEYEGEEYNVTFKSDETLLSGHQYTLDLTLDQNEETFSIDLINSTLNDWNEGVIPEPEAEEYTLDNIPSDIADVYSDEIVVTDGGSDFSETDFADLRDLVEAFAGSGRQITLTLPNMEAVPYSAMSGKGRDFSALVALNAPKVKSFEEMSFYACRSLASINIPEATSIGKIAFAYTAITEISLPKVTTVHTGGFYECALLETVVAPKVEVIEDDAFHLCYVLKEANFPNLTEMGIYTFRCCSEMTKVYMPKLKELGTRAFDECFELAEMDLSSLEVVGDYAFSECLAFTTISLPEVTYIDESAFAKCKNVTHFDLPKAQHIGRDAFTICWSLEEIDLPEAQVIDDGAFSQVKYIKRVTLGKASSIGTGLFYDSPAIEYFEVGTSGGVQLVDVHEKIFYGCQLLNIDLVIGKESGTHLVGPYWYIDATDQRFGPFKSITKI